MTFLAETPEAEGARAPSAADTRHKRMIAAAETLARIGFARIGWALQVEEKRAGSRSGNRWQETAIEDPALVVDLLGGSRNSLIIPKGRGLVIDLDDPAGFGELAAAGLPPTLTIDSPTPGHGHIYGWAPADVDMATIPGTFASGEIRRHDPRTGTASMVLGPWSLRSDGTYTPRGDVRTIAEFPRAVIDCLIASAGRQDAERKAARGPANPGWMIHHPGRHDELVDRARNLRGHGLTGDRLRDELLRFAAERCCPGGDGCEPKDYPAEIADITGWTMSNIPDDPPAIRIIGTSPSVDERENPSVNGRPALTFRSARELVISAPVTVDYIARPWCALGTIAELDGKPKSAGKTTLVLHLIRAVLDGLPFLGEPTVVTPVVLLTEQSRASIAPTLRALGLDRDELVVLTWPDAFGTPWPAIVAATVAECERIGARLLIVDTLGQFAGIRGDAENDAGAALEAMAPLQAAAAAAGGLAVLVCRHDRKAGGDVGESGRGSNAWSGAVDCIIALRRPLNPARPTIRELQAISRRGDVPTEPVLIELTDAGYVVLGSQTAVAFGESRVGILEALADGEWHAEREIVDGLPNASRTTVRDALAVLLRDHVVERGKRGRVTEPYPYRLAAVDGAAPGRQRDDGPIPLTLPPSSSPSVDAIYASVNGREETAAPGGGTCDLDVVFDEIAIDS